MILTQGQEAAAQMVKGLLAEDDSKYGVLTGFAGTGKTTMLRVLAEAHGQPAVLTPTGKAALRVSEATGLQASTIHRWLYKVTENPKSGDLSFVKKPAFEIEIPENQFIIIDEASMVSPTLWDDLWTTCASLGLKVLLVGDRFQLPPVVKRGDGWASFSTLTDLRTSHRADLTEVVRQALDSPIIRASMKIRESEFDAMDAVGELPSVKREAMVDRFLAMDPSRALIAYTNATRQQLNLEVRARRGYTNLGLQSGEPLLVLFNSYKAERFNGEVVQFDGWVDNPGIPVPVVDRWKNLATMMTFGIASVEDRAVMLSPEEVFAQTAGIPEHTITRGARDYAMKQLGYSKKDAPPHLNVNFGYCLTCHKAQGSEWKDVLVCVEPSVGAGQGGVFGYQGRRWLYTALTRAKENAVLCFS